MSFRRAIEKCTLLEKNECDALDHGFGLVYFSLFVVYLTDDRIDTYIIIIRVNGCYAGKRSVEPPTGNLRHSLSYRIYMYCP